MFTCMDKIQDDPTFKGAFALSWIRIMYASQKKPLDRRYKICKQPLVTMPMVIYTKKNFYLLDALNIKIKQLQSSGLIDFWRNEKFNIRLLNIKKTRHPKALTTNQLQGSFQVWAAGCVFSTILFIVEYLFAKISRAVANYYI